MEAVQPADEPVARWQRCGQQRWLDCAGDDLGLLAREQGFVVTSAQAAELGVQRHDVRRGVRRGSLTIPARGIVTPVVVSGGPDDPLARRRRCALAATAAALSRPGQVISGRSGAVLYGLPTFALPNTPSLTAPDVTHGRLSRTHVYRASLPGRAVTDWFGAAVALPQRVLVDLARHDRRDAIMAADAALRSGLVTPSQLDLPLSDAFGWPYSRQARDLLALADARSESPFESIVRLALHDDGFPDPELQSWIGPYRVDFYWPRFRFVLEADGRLKYEPREELDDPLWAEKRRETALRRYGVRVERVIPADVLTASAWRRTSDFLRQEMRRLPHGAARFGH